MHTEASSSREGAAESSREERKCAEKDENTLETPKEAAATTTEEIIIPTDPKIMYAMLPVQQTITTSRLRLRPIRMDDMESMFGFRTRIEIMQWSSSRPSTTTSQVEDWIKMILSTSKLRLVLCAELLHDGDGDRHIDTSEAPEAVKKTEKKPVVVGTIGIVHFPPPEIGYMLHPDYWRKGFATEMIKAFVELYWLNWPNGAEVVRSLPTVIEPPPKESETMTKAEAEAKDEDVAQKQSSQKEEESNWKYIFAQVDHANAPSWKLLESLGWYRYQDDHEQEFVNPNWGNGDGKRRAYLYRLDKPLAS